MRLPNTVRVVTFAVVAAVSAALAFAPPRFLWQNAGPQIEYPWSAAAGALLGALAVLGLGLTLPRARWRPLAFGAAALLAVWSCHLFLFRLSATGNGLHQRGLTGASTVGWREVTRVDLEAHHIAVHSPNLVLRIPTWRVSGEERARLERTIARHVREATADPPRP